jgi:hypothetical protein
MLGPSQVGLHGHFVDWTWWELPHESITNKQYDAATARQIYKLFCHIKIYSQTLLGEIVKNNQFSLKDIYYYVFLPNPLVNKVCVRV